jgi:hypothetical protein
MTTPFVLTAHVVMTLLALSATGLVVRGRVSFCWFFLVYVCATLTSDLVMATWPQRFWVFSVFSMKETLLSVLKILICLEIWQRTFSGFPRARVRVGLLLLLALLGIAFAALAIPPREGFYEALLILGSRLQAGALLLYAIVVSAAAWHRVPLHPMHRAILLGFAAYLTVHAVALSLIALDTGNTWAYEAIRPISLATYCGVSAWWAWAAWRPLRPPTDLISRLHPWAHTW